MNVYKSAMIDFLVAPAPPVPQWAREASGQRLCCVCDELAVFNELPDAVGERWDLCGQCLVALAGRFAVAKLGALRRRLDEWSFHPQVHRRQTMLARATTFVGGAQTESRVAARRRRRRLVMAISAAILVVAAGTTLVTV